VFGFERRIAARWIFLAALLFGELIFLTSTFDSPNLGGIESWWARLLRNSSIIPFWGVAATVATMMIGWDRLRDEIRRAMQYGSMQSPKLWRMFMLYHIVAFIALALLTGVVCNEDIEHYSHVWLWVLFWIGSGFATVAFAGAALFPPALWGQFLGRISGLCVAGAVLGIAACFVGRWSQELWNYWPRRPTMWIVSELLGVFCQQAYEPSRFVLGARLAGADPAFLEIAPLCSGYEGFGLIWMFLGIGVWRTRHRLRIPRTLLLISFASLMMWSAIVLRLFTLVLIALVSTERAVSAAHSELGWVIFNVLTLGIIVVASRTFGLEVSSFPLSGKRTGQSQLADRSPDSGDTVRAPLRTINSD